MHPYISHIEYFTPSTLGVLLPFFALTIGIYIRNTQFKPKHTTQDLDEKKQSRTDNAIGYPPIEPLPDFDWETTEPLVFRPFKPKYHLTMAITSLDPSALIPMDKTYLERLSLRHSLLAQYPDVVRAINTSDTQDPLTTTAIQEYYTFLMSTYLPTRYPRMFELFCSEPTTLLLRNKITNQTALVHPLPTPSTPASLLDTLATWLDEDFLILLPESGHQGPIPPTNPTAIDTEKYILQAYSTYYPAGFNPRLKLGKRLAGIHAPVPGYGEKLEKSMDRFFAKIEVGRFVQRVNWSVATGETGLFAAFGGLHGDGTEGEEEIEVGGLDVKSTVVRCERQTLHRLPKSRALVFGFHTYTYPIQEIKDEGLGEELATAIDGLKEGSVPGIHRYKRGPVWGEAVKAFLRS